MLHSNNPIGKRSDVDNDKMGYWSEAFLLFKGVKMAEGEVKKW